MCWLAGGPRSTLIALITQSEFTNLGRGINSKLRSSRANILNMVATRFSFDKIEERAETLLLSYEQHRCILPVDDGALDQHATSQLLKWLPNFCRVWLIRFWTAAAPSVSSALSYYGNVIT